MYTDIFTSPEEHDPNNFIYLVRATYGENPQKDLNTIQNEYFNASLVGRMIAENAASRIGCNETVDQTGLWTHIGLIVKPRDEDIRIAWQSCLCKDGRDLRELVAEYDGTRQEAKYLLRCPVAHYPALFNNVVVKGNPEIPVTGIYLLEMDCGLFYSSQISQYVQGVRETLGSNIPLVTAKFSEPIRDDVVSFHHDLLRELLQKEFYQSKLSMTV